jgi:hypothetical protein
MLLASLEKLYIQSQTEELGPMQRKSHLKSQELQKIAVRERGKIQQPTLSISFY